VKLIYCAYNLMEQDGPPDWIQKFKTNPVVRQERWSIYDPYFTFTENVGTDVGLMSRLNDEARLKKIDPVALKLDPQLLSPIGVVLDRIKVSDNSPTIDIPFRELYVLLRSDIVLADLNSMGHGEVSQEVMYGYLFGVPVVGLSHRFILSPWIAGKLRSVIFPRTTDEIVQQVLAYDHKTTAMINHYRATAEAEKTATQAEAEKNDVQQSLSPVHGAEIPGSV